MTSRTILVHCCLARLTIRITLLHKLFDLWYCLHNACREVLDVDALILALLEVQFAIHRLGQQITDLLVIDF
jgi:hypothetical protein